MMMFKNTPISEVEASYAGLHKPLVSLDERQTIQAALKTFLKLDILSAPVTRSTNGEIFGIVNVVDLLYYTVFQPCFNKYDTDLKMSQLSPRLVKEITDPAQLMVPLQDIMTGLSLESQRFWTFDSSQPLIELLNAFTLGVHRVIVSNKASPGSTPQFISQTDVVRYLRTRLSTSPALESTISELDLGTTELQTQSEIATAITAFRRMLIRQEMSAVPIVDSTGALVDTLSSSDVRLICGEAGELHPERLLMPVTDFLQEQGGRRRPITCIPDEKLGKVMDKMLVGQVHRCWVVQPGTNKLAGVVSMTDIIKLFSIYHNMSH
jgi:CBS domain-containing protein